MLMRYCWYISLAAACIALPAHSADNGITTQQAERIINELVQIKALLANLDGSARAPFVEPRSVTLKLPTTAVGLGSSQAPVTVVEFGDYECPFCRRFHAEAFSRLKAEYIATGLVKFYLLDLPLSIHPHAMEAARVARCAGEQNAFWPMLDVLMEGTVSINVANAINQVSEDGILSDETLRQCLASGKYNDSIQADISEARRIGATGTPSFVVGRATAGAIKGELIIGALPYEVLKRRLDSLITP